VELELDSPSITLRPPVGLPPLPEITMLSNDAPDDKSIGGRPLGTKLGTWTRLITTDESTLESPCDWSVTIARVTGVRTVGRENCT
jgi:hypothetical protein